MSDHPVLQASDISVTFGGVRAVRHISLVVGAGEYVGLIGPNGSGKSTFLNALCGIVAASGTLAVDGYPVRLGHPGASRRAGVLRVFQAPQTFTNLTCLENVLLATSDRSHAGLAGAWSARRRMWRREQERFAVAYAALDRVGLAATAELPASLLTYGQQRLLDLARAISAGPKLLLLDEPSAGLNDAETGELAAIIEGLGASGMTLILVDHKVDFVDRICPRIVAMELGEKIADAPSQEIWSDPRVADAYLGVDIDDA
jgi:branched-chain amino acid transport system ATP-binding protein